MPFPFKAFTHTALDVTRNVESKHTLLLRTLAANCGALGSNKKGNVSFEILKAFLMWLGVTDKIEAAACKKHVQIRKHKTIVRVVGGAKWDNAKRSTPVHLFIVQTCPRAAADDDERLDSEKVNVFTTPQNVWDCENSLFTEPFINRSAWTSFNAMT